MAAVSFRSGLHSRRPFLQRRFYVAMGNIKTRWECGGLRNPIARIAVSRDPGDASGCPSSAKVEIQ